MLRLVYLKGATNEQGDLEIIYISMDVSRKSFAVHARGEKKMVVPCDEIEAPWAALKATTSDVRVRSETTCF
jgi:hypothetical protein